MTLTNPTEYLALMKAGADVALTAPQPAALYLSLAAEAASSNRRLTIHRAELVSASELREVAERARGHVTLQFSHVDDPSHAPKG